MADIGIIKFQLGGIQFGIHADRILQIVRFSRARKIPRSLPYVVGLAEHRKYLVTVVDLRKRLGLSPFNLEPGITMIITKISSGMIGILVESLSHFKRISETRILPPLSIAGFPEYLLHGVLTEGDEILIIPNLDKIFSSYIRVTLLPITPAEKIAFQYRFTPGSLTRTLENTLMMQGYLDQNLVNKLPRSMSLPSVFVHKITSYYPDFMPQEASQEQNDWNRIPTQTFKAGDETYLSLSQTLLDQRPERDTETTKNYLREKQEIDALLQAEVAMSGECHLEHLLRYATYDNNVIIFDPKLGKHLAEILRVSQTLLTSYLSYYTFDKLSQQRTMLPQAFGKVLVKAEPPVLLSEPRLRELCQTFTQVDSMLHALHEEHVQITRRQMRFIAKYYQVSPVKIARIRMLFPHLVFIPEPDEQDCNSPIESEQTTTGPTGQLTEYPQESELTKSQTDSYHLSGASISSWAQFLDAQHVLTENQAVRYAAAQLGVPTCRLSKFRSYYQLSIEN